MIPPRRHSARLLALLLVPLLVLVGTGRAQAFYLCASDLVARTKCCCPKAEKPSDDTPARVVTARCCSIEERGAAAPVARSVDRDLTPVIAMPIVVAATPAARMPPRHLTSLVQPRSHAPPRPAARSSQLVVLLL